MFKDKEKGEKRRKRDHRRVIQKSCLSGFVLIVQIYFSLFSFTLWFILNRRFLCTFLLYPSFFFFFKFIPVSLGKERIRVWISSYFNPLLFYFVSLLSLLSSLAFWSLFLSFKLWFSYFSCKISFHSHHIYSFLLHFFPSLKQKQLSEISLFNTILKEREFWYYFGHSFVRQEFDRSAVQ